VKFQGKLQVSLSNFFKKWAKDGLILNSCFSKVMPIQLHTNGYVLWKEDVCPHPREGHLFLLWIPMFLWDSIID
jgi:hypothetical protein